MVEPERVRRLLAALREYRDALEQLTTLDRAAYAADHAYAGRYLVQASAQACIDLASHVIASAGWEAPRDFRDTFTVLEHHSVLSPELAERMRDLAGLRNRLVHVYGEIDDGRVYDYVSDDLDDLDAFARSIAALLTD